MQQPQRSQLYRRTNPLIHQELHTCAGIFPQPTQGPSSINQGLARLDVPPGLPPLEQQTGQPGMTTSQLEQLLASQSVSGQARAPQQERLRPLFARNNVLLSTASANSARPADAFTQPLNQSE